MLMEIFSFFCFRVTKMCFIQKEKEKEKENAVALFKQDEN